MPHSTIPHYTLSSREYAVVEGLYFTLLRRIHHSKMLADREKVFYIDKLGAALSSTRDNGRKLDNLNAVQAELDTVLA